MSCDTKRESAATCCCRSSEPYAEAEDKPEFKSEGGLDKMSTRKMVLGHVLIFMDEKKPIVLKYLYVGVLFHFSFKRFFFHL